MKELVNNHLQATNGQLGAAGHDGTVMRGEGAGSTAWWSQCLTSAQRPVWCIL